MVRRTPTFQNMQVRIRSRTGLRDWIKFSCDRVYGPKPGQFLTDLVADQISTSEDGAKKEVGETHQARHSHSES